jgi:hypothetical protein
MAEVGSLNSQVAAAASARPAARATIRRKVEICRLGEPME